METKKKSWFRRHWFLTALMVLAILVIIGMAISPEDTKENNQETQTKQLSVWEKSSGYTLKECYSVCKEVMPTQIQENVCVGGCDAIGKEGETLDRIVNTHKENYLERTK